MIFFRQFVEHIKNKHMVFVLCKSSHMSYHIFTIQIEFLSLFISHLHIISIFLYIQRIVYYLYVFFPK